MQMTPTQTSAPLVTDSVTMLGADARGRAAIAASHGGIYAAYLAAKAGLKAVILSDAGVGRERAGISGLAYLATMGVPAAAIGHRSARIGDGVDCAKRGIITCVNEPAAAAGIRAGMHASVALDLLAASELPAAPIPAPQEETRRRVSEAEADGIAVLALDSASLVTPQDAGAIVLTGSHGALLGGRPETAIKIEPLANEAVANAGTRFKVRFKVIDSKTGAAKTDLNDLTVLVFLSPGIWQQRDFASSLGEGVYETSFVPPSAGVYYVFFQSASLGLSFNSLTPLTIQAVKN